MQCVLLFSIALLMMTVVMVTGCGRSGGGGRGSAPADTTKPTITCPQDRTEYADPFQINTKVHWDEDVIHAFDDRDGELEWSRTGRRPGYLFSEGTTTITYSTRDRSGNYASCNMRITVTVLACHKWGQIEDGWKQCYVNHNTSHVRRGSVCDFGCYGGHELVGANKAKCLDSQNWDISTQPYCQRLQCPSLVPTYDQFSLVDIVCTDGDYYRSQCSYNCVPGYSILPGYSKVQICDEFGFWLGNKPTCVDSEPPSYITCPYVVTGYAERSKTSGRVWWNQPQAVDNSGQVTTIQLTNISTGTDLEVGEYYVVYLSYDAANNTAICDFKVVVKQIKCHTIYPLPYTNVMCPEGRIYGSECEFTCDNHTRIAGNRLAQCVKEGSTIQYGVWSFDNNQPYCELEESCPALQPPANGALACDTWLAGRFCQLFCEEGYVVTDDNKTAVNEINKQRQLLVCSDSYTWLNTENVELPPCEKVVDRYRIIIQLKIEYLYYTGNCEENLDQIKANFITRIRSAYNNQCDPDDCNTNNVQVTCGIRTRKKKSVSKRDVYDGLSLDFDFELPTDIDSTESLLKKQAFRNSLNEALASGEFNLPGYDENQIALDISGPFGECNYGSAFDENTLLCVECSAGRYYDTTKKKCVRCPRGQYQPLSRQPKCIDCPIGTTTSSLGAISQLQCEVACTAGYYSKTGIPPCTACDHGTYSSNYGSITCTKCSGSKITLKSASTSITQCQDFDITYTPLNSTESVVPAVLTHQNITSIDDITVELWVKCSLCDNILDITNTEDAPLLSIEGTEQLKITWLGNVYQTGEIIKEADTWKRITIDTASGFISVSINDIELITGAYTMVPASTLVNITIGGDGYIGSISQFNIWSAGYTRPPTSEETCFIEDEGDLIAWQQVSETDGTFVLTQSECDAFDNCQSQPCQNNGTCSDKIDDFTCTCTEGFNGTTCEINIDDCIDKSCDNGGTCLDGINNSTCLCRHGYIGDLCEYKYVDGEWSDWIESNGCSVTCGKGTKVISRTCDEPEPLYTGKKCEGDNFREVECDTNVTCIEDCKTDPTIQNGKANCSWTDDSNTTRVCSPYCDDGYDFSSLMFIGTSGIKCGPETGNTWNFNTEDYLMNVLPSCTSRTKAITNNITMYNSYPTLDDNDITPELSNKIEGVIDNEIAVIGCAGTGRCSREVKVGMSDDDHSRKRRSTNSVEFTINLSCEVNDDMDECYDLLYDLVQQINNMITQLQFTIQSGGLEHNVGVNSSTYDGLSTCTPGYIPVWQYCIPCGIGTYAYNDYCEVCPKGTYQDLEGQTSCKQCPENWSTAGLMTNDKKYCNVYIEPTEDTTNTLLIGLAVGLSLLVLALLIIVFVIYKIITKSPNDTIANRRRHGMDNSNTVFQPYTIHSKVKNPVIPFIPRMDALYDNSLFEEKELRPISPPPMYNNYTADEGSTEINSRPSSGRPSSGRPFSSRSRVYPANVDIDLQ
ncbi:positive regulation of smoothened signaling pathway [Mactra antiquata]